MNAPAGEWKPYSGMLPNVLAGLGATPTQFANSWWARTEDGSIVRYQPWRGDVRARLRTAAAADTAVDARRCPTRLSQHGCTNGYTDVQTFQTAASRLVATPPER